MTEREKYLQVRREAAWTGLALVFLILFWLAAGFGLAGLEVRVLHLPLWALAGSAGVWGVAILLVRLLTKGIFRDMPLDGEGMGHE